MEILAASSKKENVVFDYTLFLSASCKHRFTFLDAIKACIPAFEISWRSSLPSGLSVSEQLQMQALKVLSTNVSDASNLVRLLRLARSEHIDEIVISLPYSLDEEQLLLIEEKSGCHIGFIEDNNEQLRVSI
ncbi:hypothetical protein C9J48_20685 [Photobacterium profundum]|uniref:Transporter n=1 Tax=Photobacterium profundum 3TCK TaxID=314280 RepID=Q1Z8U6_9GAMM|nr:hypothetical protein [Photobacterium profundum]EAS45012.1 hypothetical protein P3TCK_21050 [Photobacterium profundum 3TCK]PSV60089.1 hypothetical protein C9J48_20685 [Photobacterium profundum]